MINSLLLLIFTNWTSEGNEVGDEEESIDWLSSSERKLFHRVRRSEKAGFSRYSFNSSYPDKLSKWQRLLTIDMYLPNDEMPSWETKPTGSKTYWLWTDERIKFSWDMVSSIITDSFISKIKNSCFKI